MPKRAHNALGKAGRGWGGGAEGIRLPKRALKGLTAERRQRIPSVSTAPDTRPGALGWTPMDLVTDELPDIPADIVLAELRAYLADAADLEIQELPTRCSPWVVRDVTAHLAATFTRFNQMLAQSRAGDLTPPFEPRGLSDENLARVADFTGDPLAALEREALAFIAEATNPDEMIAHQFGPLPMRVQMGFALNELAIHHDDLAHACRRTYEPPLATQALLAKAWDRLGGLPIEEPGDTDWSRVLRASGR